MSVQNIEKPTNRLTDKWITNYYILSVRRFGALVEVIVEVVVEVIVEVVVEVIVEFVVEVIVEVIVEVVVEVRFRIL